MTSTSPTVPAAGSAHSTRRGAGPAYALVTAARNEAALIERTLRSVTAQTMLPSAWVIVSDGSTDATDDIAHAYAARFPFIQVVRIDRQDGRNFVSKVHAVRAGFAKLEAGPFDFVGNLDADLSFGPAYFERLLEQFDADPGLGLAGGWILEESAGAFLPRPFNSREWVPHAVQLLRRECYEAIGDYVALPYGGEDTCAVIKARMHGWKAQAFPELPVEHHRRTSSAGGALRNRFRAGMMDHSLGYHPAYELVKCGRRVAQRPVAIGAVASWIGFAAGYARRAPRAVPPEVVAYIRREQAERVRTLIGWPLRSKSA